VAALVCLLAPAASAADNAAESGRYSMTPTANGFLRLDKQTGAVSICVVKGESAECHAAADDRAPTPPAAGLPDKQELGRTLDFAEEFMRRMMRLMREQDQPRDHI